MNLDFIILYVRDMEKSKAFYKDVLGLTVLEDVSSPTFVTLRPSAGRAMVALQDKSASRLPPGKERGPGGVELSFEVEDVDATWRLWKERGVDLVTDPMDLPFGRYFMARDPEGYYLSAYRFTRRSASLPESPYQAG